MAFVASRTLFYAQSRVCLIGSRNVSPRYILEPKSDPKPTPPREIDVPSISQYSSGTTVTSDTIFEIGDAQYTPATREFGIDHEYYLQDDFE